MPLSPLQRRVMATIAAQRNPESYIAGGAALHRRGTRGSNDIDIFNDREEVLDEAVAADATRLEWVVDSEFRFFPVVADEEFGFLLHPLDLAANKVLAAAGRFEARDAVDVLWIDEHIQPLGALAWAACEEDPGWMPESILAEIKFKSRYHDYQLADLQLDCSIAAADLNNRLRAAVGRAEYLVAAIPRSLPYGALLRPDGSLAQPDPDRPETLEGLVVHHGSRKGAWPSSPEIGSAMLRERS